MTILSLLLTPAMGFSRDILCFDETDDDWCPCEPPNGSAMNYRIVSGGGAQTFNASEIEQIQRGAAAWTGGAGELNVGFNWEFQYTGTTNQTANLLVNGITEVVRYPALFTLLGGGQDHAMMVWHDPGACGGNPEPLQPLDFTVLLNGNNLSGPGRLWSNGGGPHMQGFQSHQNVYAQSNITVLAIRLIVAHEFGHVLSLDHDDTFFSLMNQSTSFSGDPGHIEFNSPAWTNEAVRLNEDDYLAIASIKGTFSFWGNTPAPFVNFTVNNSRGRGTTTANGQYNHWNDYDPFDVCYQSGEVDHPVPPASALVSSDVKFTFGNPTYASRFVGVEWCLVNSHLSPSVEMCSDSTGATLRLDNSPTTLNPPAHLPSAETGAFYLRVCVDPGNAVAETSEADNCAFSAGPTFTVAKHSWCP
ncbi:MAG: hypothetical protein R3F61_15550 [Myxococcota bacterium]